MTDRVAATPSEPVDRDRPRWTHRRSSMPTHGTLPTPIEEEVSAIIQAFTVGSLLQPTAGHSSSSTTSTVLEKIHDARHTTEDELKAEMETEFETEALDEDPVQLVQTMSRDLYSLNLELEAMEGPRNVSFSDTIRAKTFHVDSPPSRKRRRSKFLPSRLAMVPTAAATAFQMLSPVETGELASQSVIAAGKSRPRLGHLRGSNSVDSSSSPMRKCFSGPILKRNRMDSTTSPYMSAPLKSILKSRPLSSSDPNQLNKGPRSPRSGALVANTTVKDSESTSSLQQLDRKPLFGPESIRIPEMDHLKLQSDETVRESGYFSRELDKEASSLQSHYSLATVESTWNHWTGSIMRRLSHHQEDRAAKIHPAPPAESIHHTCR